MTAAVRQVIAGHQAMTTSRIPNESGGVVVVVKAVVWGQDLEPALGEAPELTPFVAVTPDVAGGELALPGRSGHSNTTMNARVMTCHRRGHRHEPIVGVAAQALKETMKRHETKPGHHQRLLSHVRPTG